jgi:hypothetical protein
VSDETPVQRIALPTTEDWNNGYWHNWDMMRTFRPREIILYAETPAGTKKKDEPFHPAYAAPFVMELVSLADARECQKISSSEYNSTTKRLKKAAGIMVKEISDFDTFSMPEYRRPVINTMYFGLLTPKI